LCAHAIKLSSQLHTQSISLLGSRHSQQKHVGLCFEKLGLSLYDFLKKNKYRGFPAGHVCKIAFQLLQSLEFCHDTMQ
jgi:serine/threonine protein kinase